MPFEDISDPDAVLRALEEFRAIGQLRFLKKYGFGASRGWLIRDRDGQEYDAKAILGAAHGYQHPTLGPLSSDKFHGGLPTALKLRELGFTVTEPSITRRNPVWTRDELILALDLYMRHRPTFPGDNHPEVVELSQLLNRLATTTTTSRGDNFRNGNGVAMKLQNFRRFDPSQNGRGLPGGGKGETEVWETFASSPERLRQTAAAILAVISTPGEGEVYQEQDFGEEAEAEEGKILSRLHRTRERNKGLVEKRKAKALRDHGKLTCEACDMSFFDHYGERGRSFIECHHTKPVSALLPGDKTKLEDLALLCANCHRMVHVCRPWLSLDELKQTLIAARRQ